MNAGLRIYREKNEKRGVGLLAQLYIIKKGVKKQ